MMLFEPKVSLSLISKMLWLCQFFHLIDVMSVRAWCILGFIGIPLSGRQWVKEALSTPDQLSPTWHSILRFWMSQTNKKHKRHSGSTFTDMCSCYCIKRNRQKCHVRDYSASGIHKAQLKRVKTCAVQKPQTMTVTSEPIKYQNMSYHQNLLCSFASNIVKSKQLFGTVAQPWLPSFGLEPCFI